MADRRLAQMQPQRGARDMTLGQQGFEHDQQVQVDVAQIIHPANIKR
ncbi:hypothetical protein [Cupriavidus sp. H18C1]